MPFDPLSEIDISEDWQVSAPTVGNFFRFTYSNNSGFSYLVVAQAQVGDGGSLELFGTFRFALKGQGADIAELEIPRVFSPGQRRLAVRGLGPSKQTGKTLHLSIEATAMIINPSGATSKEVFTNFAQTDGVNREMVPANPTRNGGIIYNKGSRALYVGFGINAEKSSPNKILPGGMMDIPNNFYQVIYGIFDGPDPAPTARAIVAEMVA